MGLSVKPWKKEDKRLFQKMQNEKNFETRLEKGRKRAEEKEKRYLSKIEKEEENYE